MACVPDASSRFECISVCCYILFMSHRFPLHDTSHDARAVLDRAYAAMSPAEKLERVRSLTQSANIIALAGLRRRHPAESDGTLLLRLAAMRLGDDLARQVYGKLPGDT